MGYVPSGAFSAEGARHDLSRYQHRGTGARSTALTGRLVWQFGEDLAAQFLQRHGFRVLDRNVRVGRGEIDLIATDGARRVAVEVKTVAADDPLLPLEAFDEHKAAQVRRLAANLRPAATRIDLVAINLTASGVSIRWLRNAA